ncbi:MAG: HAD-IA family hydrolase [Microgenomates group bacterium]|nr:HAD-IA family hydrolase [Microgenomates group bacterium]
MVKKKTIIFDFDGTIADTLPYIFKIIKKLANDEGIEINDRQIQQARDKSPIDIIKMFNLPLLKLPFLIVKGQRMLKENILKIKLYPKIKDGLLSLKEKGYRLGVLSSNSIENLNLFFKKNKIEIFDFIKSSNNFFGKAWALQTIIKEYKLKKEEIIYVGDEVRDIEACRKVGIDIIAVTWGFNSKKILEKYRPTFLIDDPNQLLNL